jgi:hypothetical protein
VRVISKVIVVNEETFQPELQVVIRIPLEKMKDSPQEGSTEETVEKFKQELIDCIQRAPILNQLQPDDSLLS